MLGVDAETLVHTRYVKKVRLLLLHANETDALVKELLRIAFHVSTPEKVH